MSSQMNWMMIVFVLGVIIFNSVGALFLKKGSKKFFISFRLKFFVELFRNRLLLLGIFFYSISTVCFILALRLGELSVVYPLTSVSYVSISMLSAYFLKERINWYKWLGIAFIILGVVLVKI
jgi:multidrug transporter EmrE-like cation transporter